MQPQKSDNMKSIIRKKTVAALIFVIGAAAVICGGFYIWNQAMRTKDARKLQECGWQYAMTDAGYALSYRKIGSDTAEHIVIPLADAGADDMAETIEPMAACLENGTLFLCMDRAGYGLSSDTQIPQTIEQVVADYRSALKDAHIEPPYILLPHSYGGMIAAYWESLYPDEIEGVFFLDTFGNGAFGETSAAQVTWMQRFGAKFGIPRFDRRITDALPPDYSAVQKTNAARLALHSFGTYAKASEAALMQENCQTAYEAIVTNDIPKTYINAASFRTADDWLRADDWARTFRRMPELSDAERSEAADRAVEACRTNTESQVKPFTEQLGNCEYMELSGDHYIYMQKPAKCAVLFSRFLMRL